MTTSEARDYLALAAETATGRAAIQAAGYGRLLDDDIDIRKGDDTSVILVARAVSEQVLRRLIVR